tara:strand:+ start:3088 stop:3843 length:756 start_codon:yes stop_codon:yes gene_type:complete
MINYSGKMSESFCKTALNMADREKGKPTDVERNKIHGLSTIRTRCLISNLCAKANTNYLEIGVYKGSTIIAAMFDNLSTKAVGIEHFLYDEREANKWAPEGHIWDNMKSQLEANLGIYRTRERLNIDNFTLIEKPFEEVDWSKQPKFDVVHFDVAPVSEKVYDDFFSLVVPSLAMESVVVFTQQSNSQFAELLNKAILKHSDKVTERFKEYRISNSMSDSYKYFSGIAMVGLKRKIGIKPATTTVKMKANT